MKVRGNKPRGHNPGTVGAKRKLEAWLRPMEAATCAGRREDLGGGAEGVPNLRLSLQPSLLPGWSFTVRAFPWSQKLLSPSQRLREKGPGWGQERGHRVSCQDLGDWVPAPLLWAGGLTVSKA